MDLKKRSTFKDFVLENAKILFKKNHRFDWRDGNSRPLNDDEKVVQAFEKFIDLNNEVTEDRIETQVNGIFEYVFSAALF